MSEVRLIDANALKKMVDKRGKSDCVDWFGCVYSIADMYDLIDNAPAVNTVNLEKQSFIEGFKEGCEHGKKCYERPHGEWIIDGHHIRCNRCNEYICNTDREGNKIPNSFCPNCGAAMRGEKDE